MDDKEWRDIGAEAEQKTVFRTHSDSKRKGAISMRARPIFLPQVPDDLLDIWDKTLALLAKQGGQFLGCWASLSQGTPLAKKV